MEGTKIAHGVCIYTGIDTKLSLNSNNPRHKRYVLVLTVHTCTSLLRIIVVLIRVCMHVHRSAMEHEMNRQMYIIFIMQFCLVFLSACIGMIMIVFCTLIDMVD